MTGVTGITRMTRMTRSQGPYPFLNQKFNDFQEHISHSSRIPIVALSIIMPSLVVPQPDCNFNFYPEDLSVFVPFRHLRVWVGKNEH